MSKKSTVLSKAKVEKKDEFYTCYEDIEVEVKHYGAKLRDKVVYCNCDDYRKSNFVKYFKDNFHKFKLKHLHATNLDTGEGSFHYSYDGINETITPLANGSFDSDECVDILVSSDIVITNPPFSLFRKFVDLIFENNKHLIVIGNQNAITYKNIFTYILRNRLRVERGGFKGTVGYFYSPYETYEDMGEKKDNRMRVNGVCWFSSLPNKRGSATKGFTKQYNPNHYKTFDDTQVIFVETVRDIPQDYTGLMGVPITYLYEHDENEYELIGKVSSAGFMGNDSYSFRSIINGERKYHRVVIQKV